MGNSIRFDDDSCCFKNNVNLADTLVCENGLPVRTAHELDAAVFTRTLDPVAFVEARTILGGAAPAATAGLLEEQFKRLKEDNGWLGAEKQKLAAASKILHRQVNELLAE